MSKVHWVITVLGLLVTFVLGCIVAPQGMTRKEIIEVNQQLSMENLRLRAELDTFKEECSAHK